MKPGYAFAATVASSYDTGGTGSPASGTGVTVATGVPSGA